MIINSYTFLVSGIIESAMCHLISSSNWPYGMHQISSLSFEINLIGFHISRVGISPSITNLPSVFA